jgi:hypothetical protein
MFRTGAATKVAAPVFYCPRVVASACAATWFRTLRLAMEVT